MTREDAEALQIGDKVRFIQDNVSGLIFDKGYRAISVKWEDGQIGSVAFADSDTIQKEAQ